MQIQLTLTVVDLNDCMLVLSGCLSSSDDVYISLFLLSLAKEEKCVPEVSGRAAAVGNSR